MQIKLLNKEITSNFIEELLRERGIENPYRFLHPGPDSLQSWGDLDNIEEGVRLIKKMMSNPSASIGLIIDSDADGYTSAAIIHQYLKRIHCDNVTWYFHTGKQHGFEDVWEDMIEAKHDLIICPDAGSNDGKFIQNFDCPVLVLDHHILEEDSVIPPNMILINNQTSQKYKNKNLSGAGVVFQFCRALDTELGYNFAWDYVDLAAVGIDGDVMSGLEIENQYIWREGFSHVNNYFLKVLLEKQSYSMGGKINPISVAFYIVPLINAMIRIGTQDEKYRMFLAFCDGHQMVPCNKRGAKGTFEEVAVESVRECTNAKAHQAKWREDVSNTLDNLIKEKDLLKHQVLILEVDDTDCPKELTGLVATQVANKYNKPTIVTRKSDEGVLRGSARGLKNSQMGSFKDYLASTNKFEYTLGHDEAFGCSIPEEEVPALLEQVDKELKDIDFGEDVIGVNFICTPYTDWTEQLINEIEKYRYVFSQQNDEPIICVQNIILHTHDINIIGKNQDTVKFIKNGITYIKFKAKDFMQDLAKYDAMSVSITGRANVNVWNGVSTPQIFIDNYEVKNGALEF